MTKSLQGDVCAPCGIAANVLTCLKKYHDRPRELAFECSTWHEAKCAACGKKAWVTEQRDFFYPDFTLLQRAKKGISLARL